MNEADPSFFALLRLAHLVLLRDGDLAEGETDWFRRVCERHGVTPGQSEILRADAGAPPSVRELFEAIDDADLNRVLPFVETAMAADGEIAREEVDLRAEIETELRLARDRTPRLDGTYAALATNLIATTRRKAIWEALQEAGEIARQPKLSVLIKKILSYA